MKKKLIMTNIYRGESSPGRIGNLNEITKSRKRFFRKFVKQAKDNFKLQSSLYNYNITLNQDRIYYEHY